MKILIIFIIANILNVIIQTAKSIITIKGNKLQASTANAVAYGLYTYILILMTCELSTLAKCLIVAICNLIGVWIVKSIEEKRNKTKLWKIEFNTTFDEKITEILETLDISYNKIATNNGTTFNVFAKSKQQTKAIKEIIKKYHCKYFIYENKYNF